MLLVRPTSDSGLKASEEQYLFATAQHIPTADLSLDEWMTWCKAGSLQAAAEAWAVTSHMDAFGKSPGLPQIIKQSFEKARASFNAASSSSIDFVKAVLASAVIVAAEYKQSRASDEPEYPADDYEE